MNRLRKFLNLSATDRRLLMSATLLLAAIRLGLWLLPFQTLRQLPAKMTRHTSTRETLGARRFAGLSGQTDQTNQIDRIDASDAIDAIVWAVTVASRYVPRATCLTQALAGQVLLARRGFPAQLHFGVTKRGGDGRLEAHAWVESRGRVLIGGYEPGRYTPLSGLQRQSL